MKFSSTTYVGTVAKALGDLNEKSIFVGGATVPFYLPEHFQDAARPTEDVDVVIEILKRTERGDFEQSLRAKGFKNDLTEGAPICRWKYNNIIVDVMSPSEQFQGFTNKWYEEGAENSNKFKVEPDLSIRILSLPYFLATKLEAFNSRGKSDFRASSDMEDIITVLDLADKNLIEETLPRPSANLKEFLKTELLSLLASVDFQDAVPGSIFDRQNAQARSEMVLARMKSLTEAL